MKLFINTIPLLGAPTGVGHYARHIAEAVDSRRDAFDPTYFYGYRSKKLSAATEGGEPSAVDGIKKWLARRTLLRRMAKKALTVGDGLRQALRGETYDCYFEPNFVLLPTVRSRRAVLTAHDFSCFLYPQWHPAERVRYMGKHFRESLERADRVITVSEAMRREALDLFGLAPERVVTIYNGVDHERFRPSSRESLTRLLGTRALPGHFILYVGTVEPRKNLGNLLRAYNALPEAAKERYPLVLAGAEGWNNADILRLIESMAAHVRLLGYVPIAELPALYTAATVFVYPSWYEGFGLPVLEAMACGCPVLTSDHAALVEVAGGAARHTPPGDPDAMAACLLEMLEDEGQRDALRRRGLERALRFSWEASARKHMELFGDLCAK